MLNLLTCIECATGFMVGRGLCRWVTQRRAWHHAQQTQAALGDAVIHLPPAEFDAWIERQAQQLAQEPAWLPAELAQLQPVPRPTFRSLWTWKTMLVTCLLWVGIVGGLYGAGWVAQEVIAWWQQPVVVVQAPPRARERRPLDEQLPLEQFFQQLYTSGMGTYLPILALMLLITSVLNMQFGWVDIGGMTRMLLVIAMLAGGVGLMISLVSSSIPAGVLNGAP